MNDHILKLNKVIERKTGRRTSRLLIGIVCNFGYSLACDGISVLDLQAATGRKAYNDRLSKVLKVKYSKTEPSISARIHKEGDVKRAIERGNALEALHDGKRVSEYNPYTRVYVLVDRIMSHIENRDARY
jgi:hypothetical protein